MGSWEVSPNLYVMFVAPPAQGRKTTTASYADDLLEDVPGVTRSTSAMTQAVLMKRLSETTDASMSIFAGEFATFIMKSGLDMFDILTDLFDGKKNVSTETISRGFEFADRPCINMLAATTPEWIAENMPQSVIGGGFASRVIFIYEDAVRRRQLFYDELVDTDEMTRLHDMLKADLIHIATGIAGEVTLTKEAKDFTEAWYQGPGSKAPPEHYKLHGYYERKPAHLLKVAQLIHFARSDTCVLEQPDIEAALAVLEAAEPSLPKVFYGVGKNKYVVDVVRIAEYIRDLGIVKRKTVLQHFTHVATPAMLDELINGMIQVGYIEAYQEGDATYFKWVYGDAIVA